MTMGLLDDQVAIVTGAGQGIGRGVARALAAEGAHVVVASRMRETGEAVAAEIERDFGSLGARALYVQTDVSKQGSIEAMVDATVEKLGGIDILVNNATPSGRMSRLENVTADAVEEHVRVNYYGAFWAMQSVFPWMKSKRRGRIISMASLNGVNAHKYTVAYNSSKEGLRALTRTAAGEWGRHGITCNVICPAAATPSWERVQKIDPQGSEQIINMKPIQRMGDAERDVGPVAVFLASEESRYVTGNTIHVDGGGHINGVPWDFEMPG